MRELRSAAMPTVIVVAISAAPLTGPALGAESLAQALAIAHRANPSLLASQEHARSLDEGIEKAKSGYRPHLVAHAGAGYFTESRHPVVDQAGASWSADVLVSQTLFDGGLTASTVRGAQANAAAEHAAAAAELEQVSMAGVIAFADVLLQRRLVALNRKALTLFERTAADTRRRAVVKEATRADVAQAEAALSGAIAQLEATKANLSMSEAAFEETLMHAPGALAEPPAVSRFVPSSRHDVLHQALSANPRIRSAESRREAARHGIDAARAQRWPTVALQGGYQHTAYGSPWGAPSTAQPDGLVGQVTVTVPLYTGGAAEADIAAAAHEFTARALQVDALKASVRTAVSQAWARMIAARAALAAVDRQRMALRTARRAVGEELRVGQRTVAELITAQQAALGAEISYLQTRRDLTLAEYTLLNLSARLMQALRLAEDAERRSNGRDGGAWSTSAVREAAWRTTVSSPGRDAAGSVASRH